MEQLNNINLAEQKKLKAEQSIDQSQQKILSQLEGLESQNQEVLKTIDSKLQAINRNIS